MGASPASDARAERSRTWFSSGARSPATRWCWPSARGARRPRPGSTLPIEVHPLKGQILRLQAPGPPVPCNVGWGHNYATTKPDGLLWAGTTEEEAGFDEETTLEARDEIGAALVKMLPAMADAQVVHQTACLRPVASDGLLLLGRVPGFDSVYMATGAGRKGILLGPAMGRAVADLIVTGKSTLALEAFSPARFARAPR